MTCEYPEVLHALGSLGRRMRLSSCAMNGQNIGNSLYSLHSMTDNSDEVKELLTALAHKIVQMDDQLTSKTRELMNPNKIM